MEMQLADLIEAKMIEKHKENPLTPIDILLISVISSSDELRQQVYSTSFFIYILKENLIPLFQDFVWAKSYR